MFQCIDILICFQRLLAELSRNQKANPGLLKNYQLSIVKSEILKRKLSFVEEKLRKKQQDSMEASRKVEEAQVILIKIGSIWLISIESYELLQL